MDHKAFYAALRRRGSGVFGTSLSQAQVDGINALLASMNRNNITDIRHAANILAQVYHETGGYMLPIKETVYAGHKNKNPSDATVIARLDRAWKAGQLGNVREPYWRDGWFGRGPIQITHHYNYAIMGERLDVNLVANPSLALDPKVGADIAVVGMKDGLFRPAYGGLSQYFNDVDADPVGARAIVNGDVRSNGGKIARYHEAFLTALREAGWTANRIVTSAPEAPPTPKDTPKPSPARPEPAQGFWARLFAFLFRRS